MIKISVDESVKGTFAILEDAIKRAEEIAEITPNYSTVYVDEWENGEPVKTYFSLEGKR